MQYLKEINWSNLSSPKRRSPDEKGDSVVKYLVSRRNDGKDEVLNGLKFTVNDNGKVSIWDAAEAPRFRRDHLLRTRSVYNATTSHTGAMSLWLMSVAAVPQVIEPAVLV